VRNFFSGNTIYCPLPCPLPQPKQDKGLERDDDEVHSAAARARNKEVQTLLGRSQK
jgi:hypothetical protein